MVRAAILPTLRPVPRPGPNTVGDQSDEASRSVAENTGEGESIGAAVAAIGMTTENACCTP